jgi:trk system potassium uptake protein TrkA
MYLIVIGAKDIGEQFIRLASEDKHELVVVERDPDVARRVVDAYDIRMLQGDVSEGGILEEAGIDEAHALIATTSQDTTNLLAVFAALDAGIQNLVSVVNEERNRPLFRRLGARMLIGPNAIAAQYLYAFVRGPRAQTIVPLPGNAQAVMATVQEGSELAGRTCGAVHEEGFLPEDARIVLLRRDQQSGFPKADTTIEEGDELTIVSTKPLSADQFSVLGG